MSYSFEVQKAVYTALAANTDLTDIVTTSGIVDDVCQGLAMPYVVIGEDVTTEWSTSHENGFIVMVTLHSWSEYKGRKQIKDIQSACYDALNRQTLTVTGYRFIDCQFISEQSFLDEDGQSRHGVQQFEILIDQL